MIRFALLQACSTTASHVDVVEEWSTWLQISYPLQISAAPSGRFVVLGSDVSIILDDGTVHWSGPPVVYPSPTEMTPVGHGASYDPTSWDRVLLASLYEGVYAHDTRSGVSEYVSAQWPLDVEPVDAPESYIARFNGIVDIEVDRSGRLYLLSTVLNCVLRVENGVASPFAGVPHLTDSLAAFKGDGQLASTVNLEIDGQSNWSGISVVDPWLYIVLYSQEVVVRVHLETGILEHVAGDPYTLVVGDDPVEEHVAAVAAGLYRPTAVAARADGTVFVVEPFRDCVRTFTVGGSIRSLAGSCGRDDSEDWPVNTPSCVEVDEVGNLYVCDTWADRIQVLRVQPQGIGPE